MCFSVRISFPDLFKIENERSLTAKSLFPNDWKFSIFIELPSIVLGNFVPETDADFANPSTHKRILLGENFTLLAQTIINKKLHVNIII